LAAALHRAKQQPMNPRVRRRAPGLLLSSAENWIDFWVICDAKQAYLFFTREHREVVVMTTPIGDFPSGFRDPQVVFSPLIEAAHVYRLQGAPERYEMLFEVAGGPLRKYGLATANALIGPWRTETTEYAHHVQFPIQAMQAAQHLGDYRALPWRLELLN
jgi:Glycosyl hydrolase family 62